MNPKTPPSNLPSIAWNHHSFLFSKDLQQAKKTVCRFRKNKGTGKLKTPLDVEGGVSYGFQCRSSPTVALVPGRNSVVLFQGFQRNIRFPEPTFDRFRFASHYLHDSFELFRGPLKLRKQSPPASHVYIYVYNIHIIFFYLGKNPENGTPPPESWIESLESFFLTINHKFAQTLTSTSTSFLHKKGGVSICIFFWF